MSYIDLLKNYLVTKEYGDLLKIFETYSIEFNKVYSDLKELDNTFYLRTMPGFRACVTNLKVAVELYNSGLTIRGVIDELHERGIDLPKTTLQCILSDLGYLRSKSEAARLSIKNGYIPYSTEKLPDGRTYYGNNIYYNLNEKVICLKSSYELAFLQQLLENKELNIEYESERIPYVDSDGLDRIYIPDFKIIDNKDTRLIEVKPERFFNDDGVIRKKISAEKYCSERGWTYELIGESDIDFSRYPNYDDPNITVSKRYLTHEELVELRRKEGHKNPDYDDHFISKIWDHQYTYKDHPRANLEITYKSIMDYVNSFPKYECTKSDVYDFCTRNQLARRLRDEASGKDKDLQYWQSHYLAIPEHTSSAQKRAMLEVQLDGIRDFGLLTLDQIFDHLRSLNKLISTSDVYQLLGWGQNKTRVYFWEVLNSDVYEVIEEINSEHKNSNKGI